MEEKQTIILKSEDIQYLQNKINRLYHMDNRWHIDHTHAIYDMLDGTTPYTIFMTRKS